MTVTADKAKSTAQDAKESKPVEGLARLGFLGRGLMYVVVGLIALQIAFGYGGRADRGGALEAVRSKPLGGTLLVVLTVGFAGYAVWRLLEGVVGHRGEKKSKRWRKRVASFSRGLLYCAITFSTVQFLVTHRHDDHTRPWTTRVMEEPGGRLLVTAVGLGLAGSGLYVLYRGLARKFLKRVDLSSAPRRVRRVVEVVGVVGHLGRGTVFFLVGAFLVQAAVTFDPDKAKGPDAALKALAGQPYGPALLTAVALGLVCYGVWTLLGSRYRRL